MKKTLSVLATLLLAGMAMAQQPTFVSTLPGGRCVLIEEYTGIYCQFCPDGHRIANQLIASNPDSIFAINIHQGPYTAGTYTTSYGDALANQTGLDGYPSGTVNRHVFSGNSTALNRTEWEGAAHAILAMSSPCNVAIRVNIDNATRVATIEAEVYYTGNAGSSTNLLNIALLQDSVMGQQTGSETWYPEMIRNGQYQHNHMLRDLITGQWGDTIHQTSAGSFFTKTYTYTIPQSIGGVAINNDFEHLQFVAFVTETHQEVLTATKATLPTEHPTLSALSGEVDCNFNFTPVLRIKNSTTEDVSNMVFDVNGQTYTMNRTLASGAVDTLHFAPITVSERPEVGADITTPGEEVVCTLQSYTRGTETVQPEGYEVSATIGAVTLYGVNDGMRIRVMNDAVGGAETSLELTAYDGNCTSVWSKEPSNADNNSIRNYTVAVPQSGIYCLRVTDKGGNGMSSVVKGVVIKTYDNASEIKRVLGNYGSGFNVYFYVVEATASIDEGDKGSSLALYPNPVSGVLNIQGAEPTDQLEVSDLEGRMLLRGQGSTLDASSLANGIYMLRVVSERGTAVQKFVKE